MTTSTGTPSSAPTQPEPRQFGVVIPAAGASLAGTMTMPANDSSVRPPVVLLLPGSGPVDRDSNYRSMRFDITRQLALAFAAAGIASLRYDKRGVGASSGGDWRAVGLWELADDARSALTFLAARPEVDGRSIVVLGHSEGAIIATHLAAHDSRACAAVLLSGSATSGEALLMWQARNVVPSLPAPVRGALRLLRIDPIEKVAKNHAKLKATTTNVARIGGARTNAKWFREFMAHDPADDLRAITIPVLAITGRKDLQVDPADLEIDCRAGSRSGDGRMSCPRHPHAQAATGTGQPPCIQEGTTAARGRDTDGHRRCVDPPRGEVVRGRRGGARDRHGSARSLTGRHEQERRPARSPRR